MTKLPALDSLPHDGETHLNLLAYAAVLRLAEEIVFQSAAPEHALETFPVLTAYLADLVNFGLEGLEFAAARRAWLDVVARWEGDAPAPLPITRLRQAGLNDDDLLLLVTLGLSEIDARLGTVFEALDETPGLRQPSALLLTRLAESASAARRSLQRLLHLGLIAPDDAPVSERGHRPVPLLWGVLQSGEPGPELPAGVRWVPVDACPTLDTLVLADAVRRRAEALDEMVAAGRVRCLCLRGPQHNGRRTLLQAIARGVGRSALVLDPAALAEPSPRQTAATLALLLGAAPVLSMEVAPGECAEIPLPDAPLPFVGVAIGCSGALEPGAFAPMVTLELPLPDARARRMLWASALPNNLIAASDLDTIAAQARLSSGAICRTAVDVALASSSAPVPQAAASVTLADVRRTVRQRHTHRLERLATLLEPPFASDPWRGLAVAAETARDLRLLEVRIRHREQMRDLAGAALPSATTGVRALFGGPSGTGKTLAARALAASLGMDIYRADLSTIVNKYIGETEKNLNRLFAQAEELDAILLLDEGDALLTQRTQVGNANDRYANLETDYLLQRLESYEGVLLVTTNAGDRIDGAFQRRMDAVIEFRAPDAGERWVIWQLHLPADHGIDYGFLQDVALRCQLTGGQIRNAALHAVLLALDEGSHVTAAHVEAAVQREYRKAGSLCPLRPAHAARVHAPSQNGHGSR